MTAHTAQSTRSSTAVGTRALLAGGAIAGPLFIVVVFIQVPLRAGFDWARHPLSMLSLGDPGWVQVTNFILCGALFIAGALGVRAVLRAASSLPHASRS